MRLIVGISILSFVVLLSAVILSVGVVVAASSCVTGGGCSPGYSLICWQSTSYWSTSSSSQCVCPEGYHAAGTYESSGQSSCSTGTLIYGHECGDSYESSSQSCQPDDTTPPVVDVTHSPTSPQSNQQVSFTATASDNLKDIRIYVDGGGVKTCDMTGTTQFCTSYYTWRGTTSCLSYETRTTYGSGSCQYSSTFSAGTHSYFATAKDRYSRSSTTQTNSFNVAAPIDTSSDTNNCGSIGNACGAGQTCQSGVCVVPAPPAPPAPPEPAFDFSISVDPANGAANKGDSKDVNASLALVSGSAAAVTLTAENLPAGATASFTPTSCSPNCYSNVTIATTAATPVGWQLITIKATSGSLVKTATYNLTVLGTSTTCGNLVCEYPETQSSCAADCKTTANIPSPVAPGDIVAVSVEFYDFRYLANQKVQIDLKINPENLAWIPANGCFFGGKIMGPAASGSVIQWPAGTISTDGHFKITTTCAIPGTIAAGAHTLVATPTIF